MRRAWEALLLIACLVIVVRVGSSLLQDVIPGLVALGAVLLIGSFLFNRSANRRRW